MEDLPLHWKTPERWVDTALANPVALLNDHAHLEKKAAANALDLLLRWPERIPNEAWIQAMTAVARDEVNHLQTVTRHLARRGGKLARVHANPYAAELRQLIRKGDGNRELTDRLLVSALIELRSCERFELLARYAPEAPLRKLYNSLYLSEAGHYRVFLQLARELPKPCDVDTRWAEMLAAESEIIQRQPPGPAMHSGLAAES
jgi:tRNA-(ms[2]io[6]A)-hydroxylase